MSNTKLELELYVKENITYGEHILEGFCKATEYLLDNCEITIPENNRFFAEINCKGIMQGIAQEISSSIREKIPEELLSGAEAHAFAGVYDFGHTSTNWDNVISLGIYGLRERLYEYAKADSENAFYKGALAVYDASLRFMLRVAKTARSFGKYEMADGLENLASRRPQTLFEAMQTSILYFNLQQNVEGTILRTLGRVDRLFYPFYEKESDKAYAEALVSDFVREIDTLGAISNIPIALGGSSANELSYAFLRAYHNIDTVNTKIHLLYTPDMPTDLLYETLDGVREGKNSIVYLSEDKVIESLIKIGASPDDAKEYTVVGCYECGAREEITCSCATTVNIAKAVEYTLSGGFDALFQKQIGLKGELDFKNFDEFYAEFLRQLEHLCRGAISLTDIWEESYPKMHAAPIFSATYDSSLKAGGDIYCDGSAKYNNTSLNAIGLATAVDSLYAVKKLVYEDKTLTLKELAECLSDDWKGYEELRHTVRNKFVKYGMGEKEIDVLAQDVVSRLSGYVNRKPNKKGGIYRLGTFSIDWRLPYGWRTSATPDGRRCREPISQNTGASFGADRAGATAHILSVASIDASDTPNGSVLDLDLHATAVSGKDGLNTLFYTLKTYFDLGGFAIHYNVLDAKVLKKAMAKPEDYPNLQVRLCGWNVLFADLSQSAKLEFIARFENRG